MKSERRVSREGRARKGMLMAHQPKKFEHLVGGLEGFSAKQLEAHLQLYRHYVEKINEIEERLGKADREQGDYSYSDYSELKRREAVPLNGAYLHELYFENLTPRAASPPPALAKAFGDAFGSFDAYLADLGAAAKSTAGWVVTTMSHVDARVHNYVLTEHHIGLPVHQKVLVAVDCWEHAYMIDYGIRKPDYLAALFKLVDWKEAGRRLAAAE
jgi:superoxide dismutase, Fe-Mn family